MIKLEYLLLLSFSLAIALLFIGVGIAIREWILYPTEPLIHFIHFGRWYIPLLIGQILSIVAAQIYLEIIEVAEK